MGDSYQSGVIKRSISDQERFKSLEDIDVTADGSPVLRFIISNNYSVVCAVGLIGNLLVFFFIRDRCKSKLNFFILNMAVTDFQLVLTLPFWAVDTALDFSWPFGDAMCKFVLSVTVMNMYASVFFLTAINEHHTLLVGVICAQGQRQTNQLLHQMVALILWSLATVATAPTSIFSTVTNVAGEKLCLLRFPDGQHWLAVYHLQKLLIGFIIPMAIVSMSYLMLLRLIRRRSMKNNSKRTTQVTKSVTIVVLSFSLCWMPNHAITFWGVLVKFNVVHWDKTYYIVHTYVFPVTVCLAHANSCLNPLIYCLMRREFRKKLKELFLRVRATRAVLHLFFGATATIDIKLQRIYFSCCQKCNVNRDIKRKKRYPITI